MCTFKSSSAILVASIAFLLIINITNGQINGPNRAQTISNIFQIPIQTLEAISNVAQNTRPLGEIVEERRKKKMRPNLFQQQDSLLGSPNGPSSNVVTYTINSVYNAPQLQRRGYTSRAQIVAGLPVANDGSGFRL